MIIMGGIVALYGLAQGRSADILQGLGLMLVSTVVFITRTYFVVSHNSLAFNGKLYEFESFKDLEIEDKKLYLTRDGKRETINISADKAETWDWDQFLKLIKGEIQLQAGQASSDEIRRMSSSIDVGSLREFGSSQPGQYIKALSFLDLIASIFQIYRKQFLTLLFVNTIVFGLSYLTLTFSSLAFLGVFGQLAEAVNVLVCSKAILNKPIKLLDLFKDIYLAGYVWTLFLCSLFILPIILLVFILPADSLVVPFLEGLTGFTFIFLSSIVLIEKKGVIAAFKRFFQLLFGNFWNIASKFAVAYLLYALIRTLLIALLTFLQVDVLFSVELVAMAANILCAPVIDLAAVFLYYDTRVRKENFSREILAQEMGFQAINEMMSI